MARNLVSMRVLLKIGAGTVLDHAARFGFDTSTFPRNTQLAIGGGTMAVTRLDMARAYAVLANGGYMIEPYAVTAVEDAEGNLVYRPNHPQVCKPCEEETDEAELDPAARDRPSGSHACDQPCLDSRADCGADRGAAFRPAAGYRHSAAGRASRAGDRRTQCLHHAFHAAGRDSSGHRPRRNAPAAQ